MLRASTPATGSVVGHSTRRAALAGYRTVSLEARIASATPHTLILMLYERLVAQLHEIHTHAIAGDRIQRLRITERALGIVENLDATINDQQGGNVAKSLHAVYALIREGLLSGEEAHLARALDAARTLRDSWREIAPVRKAGGQG